MSTFRARTQQKVLEKIGATTRTSNYQFDNAFVQFQAVSTKIRRMDNALRGYINALQAFHLASNTLTSEFQEVSNSHSDECPKEVQELMATFGEISQRVDVHLMPKAMEQFQQMLLKPSEGWIDQISKLHKTIADFEESRLSYDHYTRKVISLRELRDKRSVNGKNGKQKDVDKLIRNEQKLALATKAYRETSDATVRSLNEFNQSQYTTLAPMVQRFIQFRCRSSTELHDEILKLEGLGYGSIDADKLDQLAAASAFQDGDNAFDTIGSDVQTSKAKTFLQKFHGINQRGSHRDKNNAESNAFYGTRDDTTTAADTAIVVSKLDDFVSEASQSSWDAFGLHSGNETKPTAKAVDLTMEKKEKSSIPSHLEKHRFSPTPRRHPNSSSFDRLSPSARNALENKEETEDDEKDKDKDKDNVEEIGRQLSSTNQLRLNPYATEYFDDEETIPRPSTTGLGLGLGVGGGRNMTNSFATTPFATEIHPLDMKSPTSFTHQSPSKPNTVYFSSPKATSSAVAALKPGSQALVSQQHTHSERNPFSASNDFNATFNSTTNYGEQGGERQSGWMSASTHDVFLQPSRPASPTRPNRMNATTAVDANNYQDFDISWN